MTKIFDGLRPFQIAELTIMMLMAVAIPLSWLAAQYCEVALAVCAVLKVIFDQKFQFNDKQMKFKWVYVVFALTWLAYFIGMIHTQNQSVGWAQVSKKLGFLVFPLVFLISDMSYLTKDRVRTIFYCFTISILVYFLANFSWAIYDVIFRDYAVKRLFDNKLLKIYYVHHTYMSMYATLAMVFCFVEIIEKQKMKAFNIIAIVLLVVFVFLLNSRAGQLCLILVIIALWVWMTFVKQMKKAGIISSVVAVVFFAVVCMVAPSVFSRLSYTLKNIISEDSTDRRIVQLKAGNAVIKENWLFGVGSGDRSDEILASYINYRNVLVEKIVPIKGASEADFEQGRKELLKKIMQITADDTWNEPNEDMFVFIKEKSAYYKCDAESVRNVAAEYIFTENAIFHELNTHNQFTDTIISVGILGLLLMLGYFIIPLVLGIVNKRFDIVYFAFLLIIGFNALFESLFEAQKGIIFFCFFNVLLFEHVFVRENK